MNELLPELIGEIFEKLDKEIMPIASVSKSWYHLSHPFITHFKNNHFTEALPDHIIHAFGGIDKISQLPVVRLNEQ